MARLLTCPSCRRHVQAWEQDCPFCGHIGLTTSAPARLSTLLLGLCLVGCTTPKDNEKKPEEQKINVKPEPDTKTPEPPPQPDPIAPTTAVPPPTIDPPPEPASTTSEPPVEGTDAGAQIEDPKPEVELPPDNEPKPKYGGPRPQKKYGAPPKPPEDLGPL